MSRDTWLQCQVCGKLHKEKVQCSIEDIYIEVQCPRCRDKTVNLVCGNDKDEIYEFYNTNVDPRYYTYKTK